MDVPATLHQAHQRRNASDWVGALELYQSLEGQLRGQSAYHHNLALCLLGLGTADGALAQARIAHGLNPALWQAAVVKVRALRALQRHAEAASELRALHAQYPQQAEFALELADLVLHQECDALQAQRLAAPWQNHPKNGTDAQLAVLMASLYDRPDAPHSDEQLNQRLRAFAATHLERPPATETAEIVAPSKTVRKNQKKAPREGSQPGTRRLKVGLLSPLFSCSPVYFFCFSALKMLSAEFDLVFISRGKQVDWAAAEFQGIAAEWHEVVGMDSTALETFITSQALDCLVDLGGWMDPIALRAIAAKPAARMFKWVGGQSVTTGLRAFDGFITDSAQTPAGYERWFAEPLLRLPAGYVTYTPPPYMPAPVPASTSAHVLGVTANPVKASWGFLQALGQRIATHHSHSASHGLPLHLRFIDKRYTSDALKARILQTLKPALQHGGAGLKLEFVAPTSHVEYLGAVAQLSEVVDTFPYTGGLTTMEALALGVHCGSLLGQMGQSAQPGHLFCERHTHSHLHFVHQLASGKVRRAARPLKPTGQPRRSLIEGSQRTNHQALAESLGQILRGRAQAVA
jgi:protein O-GlcNAc transferase